MLRTSVELQLHHMESQVSSHETLVLDVAPQGPDFIRKLIPSTRQHYSGKQRGAEHEKDRRHSKAVPAYQVPLLRPMATMWPLHSILEEGSRTLLHERCYSFLAICEREASVIRGPLNRQPRLQCGGLGLFLSATDYIRYCAISPYLP